MRQYGTRSTASLRTILPQTSTFSQYFTSFLVLMLALMPVLSARSAADAATQSFSIPQIDSTGAISSILSSDGSMTPATGAGPGGCFVSSNACYFYVGSDQGNIKTEGATVLIQQARPKVGTHDNHSLVELAVESQDQNEIVEVGWIVIAGSQTRPQLFVYHWIKDKGTCLNGCGYVQLKGKRKPGSTVTSGATRDYGIEFTNDRWYILYSGERIGYFPERLWTSRGVTFKKAGLIQVFGEVQSSRTRLSQTQMGNGTLGNVKGADFFRGITYYRSSSGSPSLKAYEPTNRQALRVYKYGSPGATMLHLGGPGYRH